MNRKINGIVKVAASLTLAGGVLAMAAGPAFAASPNEAYGAAATGPISVSPLGLATYPGTSPVNLVNANIAGLLTTGVVTDTADATDASSTVADVSATLSALASLTATTVSSSCTFNTNTGTVSGTASIADGSVAVVGLPAITLAANPAPNTTVSVARIATITLNQQTTATDGTLTVSAIAISLLGSTQTLTLGTSVCNASDLSPVSIMPGIAMPIGLGTLGLLALGGAGYYFNRRRRVAATA
jgi:hypothetical protein